VYNAKKPKKWGYKVWVRAGQSGYVYAFYMAGDNTVATPAGIPDIIGESGKVVLRLANDLPPETYIYFGNYFSSVPLLVELNKRGFYPTCTIQKNRTGGCPLKSDKELKTEGRGAHTFHIEDNGILICQWNDNRPVTVASTVHPVNPLAEVDRYDRKNKQRIKVKCPSLITHYNKNMGGVDKADMLLALYRCFFKSRKWYKRLIFHFIDLCVNNSWLLYTKARGAKIDLVKFKLQVARTLMMTDCTETREGPPVPERTVPNPASLVPLSTRYDLINHFARPDGDRRNAQRCKLVGCKRKTTNRCEKCNIYLCTDRVSDYFYIFHHR